MTLNGHQVEVIQEVFARAFTRSELERLVRSKLEQRLENIADGRNNRETIFNLIEWADSHGVIQVLIQGAHDFNPKNHELNRLVQEFGKWQEGLLPENGQSPYQGLLYFDSTEADRYFGRELLTAQLADNLRTHQFLAVIGASGSGKSSLVRAGLVPALQNAQLSKDGCFLPEGSQHWPIHVITPKVHPLKELAISLTAHSESVTVAATLRQNMAQEVSSLDLYVTRLLQSSKANRLLIVVDQFEEIFTQCEDLSERRAFIDNLMYASAPDGCTTVVLTLRADFYHRCADFDNLRQRIHDQIYIGPMTADELQQAIKKPAHRNGWEFESGLVDLILHDVGDSPGALPLLSHALLETWKRRQGNMMTFAGYHSSGGVQGAIAKTADSTLTQKLTNEQQAIAKNIFMRLTALGESSLDTRHRVPQDDLISAAEEKQAVEAVLHTLANARLITTSQYQKHDSTSLDRIEDGISYVEIAHEALVREWSTLRNWLENSQESLRILHRLTEATREWDMLQREPAALYSGLRLDLAIEHFDAYEQQLTSLEREFLLRSIIESRRAVDYWHEIVSDAEQRIHILGDLSRHESPEIRMYIADLLATQDVPESVEPLLAIAINDPIREVQITAQLNLAKLSQQLPLIASKLQEIIKRSDRETKRRVRETVALSIRKVLPKNLQWWQLRTITPLFVHWFMSWTLVCGLAQGIGVALYLASGGAIITNVGGTVSNDIVQTIVGSELGTTISLANGIIIVRDSSQQIDGTIIIVASTLLAMAMAAGIIGIGQLFLLKRYIAVDIWWILANLFGAATGGISGIGIGIVMGLMRSDHTISMGIDLMVSALLGAIWGAVVWIVLRQHVQQAGIWILASAVGSLCAAAISHPIAAYYGMSMIAALEFDVTAISLATFITLLDGLVFGAVTAIPMFFLLQRPIIGSSIL